VCKLLGFNRFLTTEITFQVVQVHRKPCGTIKTHVSINRNCSLAQFSRLFIYGRSTVFKTISDGTRSLCFCYSCVVMRISNVDLLLYKEARLSLTTRAMLAPVSRGFCINSAVQQENYAVIVLVLLTAKLTESEWPLGVIQIQDHFVMTLIDIFLIKKFLPVVH